jgi:HEPN domain-containing protein
MVDIEIVREWIAKADEDFEFARLNFEEGKPFFGQICFHFQQAVEKYLKSYIIANELEFLKIHDLPLLLKICLSKDSSFDQLREDCEFLTTFYVDTRYPVHWPTHFSPEESQKTFQSAARIRSFVKGKLGFARE